MLTILKTNIKKLLESERKMCYYKYRNKTEVLMSYLYFSHDKKTQRMHGLHAHPRHELYYLAKGSTKYIIGDEIYLVEAGNVVFIPKGLYHMTDSGGCDNIERYLMAFDDDLFDADTEVILSELVSERLIGIPVGRIEGLEEHFAELERATMIEGELRDAAIKAHALVVLSFICRHKRAFVPKVSETDRIVHEVSEYISANYGEDLSLSFLAHRFAVSDCHLSRKFKDVSGMGLNEYITHVRIMNAERLLRSGVTSITAVAEQCGFNDSNYFSTVFKKIKGITPLKFAKQSL